MPSQPYDLVKDDHDNPDLKIPVHAEQMFYQGIKFQAKVCLNFVTFFIIFIIIDLLAQLTKVIKYVDFHEKLIVT